MKKFQGPIECMRKVFAAGMRMVLLLLGLEVVLCFLAVVIAAVVWIKNDFFAAVVACFFVVAVGQLFVTIIMEMILERDARPRPQLPQTEQNPQSPQ